MDNQTNNNNIPMNEVDEIRQQLAIFKQRLDQQEIINDRLLRRSMNARLNVFAKGSIIADIIGLLFMPVMFWGFSKIGVPWYFSGFILLMLMIETAYNIFCHRQLQRLFHDGNDLLTVRRGLLRFKRNERLQMLISVPLVLLWVLAFYWHLGLFTNGPTAVKNAGLVGSFTGVILAFTICFAVYAWEMHRINKSIKEIDELEQM